MQHQNRYPCLANKVLRHAAEDLFPPAIATVSTRDQQVCAGLFIAREQFRLDIAARGF